MKKEEKSIKELFTIFTIFFLSKNKTTARKKISSNFLFQYAFCWFAFCLADGKNIKNMNFLYRTVYTYIIT